MIKKLVFILMALLCFVGCKNKQPQESSRELLSEIRFQRALPYRLTKDISFGHKGDDYPDYSRAEESRENADRIEKEILDTATFSMETLIEERIIYPCELSEKEKTKYRKSIKHVQEIYGGELLEQYRLNIAFGSMLLDLFIYSDTESEMHDLIRRMYFQNGEHCDYLLKELKKLEIDPERLEILEEIRLW